MSETEEKQQYLCDHILDKGYDPEIFSQFMQNIRYNGGDIDQWSFLELKTVVASFQEDAENNYQLDYPKIQERLANLQIFEPAEHPIAPQNNEETPIAVKPQPIPEQKVEQKQQQQPCHKQNEEIDDNNFRKIIGCQAAECTNISENSELRAIVSKYEKKPGGIFSAAYIVYEVQTIPMNIQVFRRYNDFQWLHTTLEKIYPQISIPPVPTKKTTRSYQPLFLSKRMAFMEKYLNKLLQSPEIRKSKFLEGFLTLSSDDAFSKLMKEGDKIVRATKIPQMTTIAGETQCTLNPEVNFYIKKTSEYIGSQGIIYKKVRKLCNQLIIDYDQLSTTLFNIGDCFSQSYNLSLHYNTATKEKDHSLEELYIHLNNMSISWGNNLTGQIKLVQENLSNWFKYYDHELKAMKEYMKLKEQSEKEYTTFKQRLQVKKDRLFQLNDTSKWEISSDILSQMGQQVKNKEFVLPYMLPKETMIESEMRDLYGFYNQQAYTELKRIMKNKVTDYATHFNRFGQQQSDHISEMHIQWADLMTNMQGLKGMEGCKGLISKPTTLMESSRIRDPTSQEAGFDDC